MVSSSNTDSESISGVSMNVAQKAMKTIPGSPVAVPHVTDIARAGSFVFAVSSTTTDASTSAVYVFRSDPTTGTLSQVKTIPQPTGADSPVTAFTDPSEQYLYVGANTNGELIYGFKIGMDGSLTPIAGSPFQSFETVGHGWMYSPSFTSDGRLLFGIECPYEGGRFCSTLAVAMQRDPSTGVLTRPANNTTRNDFNVLSVAGNFVVGTWWSSYIHVYTYDSAGMLTEVSGSPITPQNASTQESCAVAAQPGTNRIYIGSGNSSGSDSPGAITAYTLDTSGKLTAGATLATGASGTSCSLLFTPSGFLAWGAGNGVEGYTVNSDGSLTPLSGSPQPVGRPKAQVGIHSATGQ